MKKRSKIKHALSLTVALGMLLFAIPQLSVRQSGPVFAFGIAWAVFALMVIAAHLHFLIGVDAERAKRLEAVRRAKLSRWEDDWRRERSVAGKL
ncbi:hypothetical protein F4V43_15390 [Paenibacillus spiritus]|uniref:Uncharacterized protein n=1 Tax=Paenibacillus spiritus TaxID=2496557 RepID=A0A5J5FZC4_9BACL|nr:MULTISPECIES: hypothetical protein [Paenibacillus]KAA8999710.1 hypothetical protein F4V43_15390 [Paenibacillus spiritus]